MLAYTRLVMAIVQVALISVGIYGCAWLCNHRALALCGWLLDRCAWSERRLVGRSLIRTKLVRHMRRVRVQFHEHVKGKPQKQPSRYAFNHQPLFRD